MKQWHRQNHASLYESRVFFDEYFCVFLSVTSATTMSITTIGRIISQTANVQQSTNQQIEHIVGPPLLARHLDAGLRCTPLSTCWLPPPRASQGRMFSSPSASAAAAARLRARETAAWNCRSASASRFRLHGEQNSWGTGPGRTGSDSNGRPRFE